MGVIGNKIDSLKKNIKNLQNFEVCLNSNDYDIIIKEAEEIVKVASFLKSYKELDAEREKDVKETIMGYLNENNTYDSALIKSVGYCFGEFD